MPNLCSPPWDSHAAWGTAAHAACWVALEQPGPWGHKAFVQSRLDPEVGRAIEQAAKAAGGRALLVRRPGAHPDDEGGPRRVLVAGGTVDAPWLLAGEVDDARAVLDLPWEQLTDREPPAVPGFAPSPAVALVCTNAKRDACCAVRGRPVALGVAAALPDRVWECSHTGGHRFAPTGLVLPTMQMFAHATPADVVAAVRAADAGDLGFVGPGSTGLADRGRSQLAPLAQVAESWVRQQGGPRGIASLSTTLDDDVALVEAVDGRTWRLRITKRPTGDALPVSCGGEAKPVEEYDIEPLEPLNGVAVAH